MPFTTFLARQKERLKKRMEKYVKMLKILAEEDRVLGVKEDILLFKLKNIVPNLNAAWQSIGEGTYGICFDCGSKIPKARLKMVPGALRCTNCQEKKEASHV